MNHDTAHTNTPKRGRSPTLSPEAKRITFMAEPRHIALIDKCHKLSGFKGQGAAIRWLLDRVEG